MIGMPEIWLHIILDTVTLKVRNKKINFIIFQFGKKTIFLCWFHRVGAFVNKNSGNRF